MMQRPSGSEAARKAWLKHQARYMTTQHLRRSQPLLFEGKLFYSASVYGVGWGALFCEEYNAEIASLLQMHGVPEWAPGLRALRKDESDNALRRFAVNDFAFLRPENQALVHRVSNYSLPDGSLFGYAHIPQRDIFIIAHRIHDALHVDVVDLREGVYMSRFVLPPMAPDRHLSSSSLDGPDPDGPDRE